MALRTSSVRLRTSSFLLSDRKCSLTDATWMPRRWAISLFASPSLSCRRTWPASGPGSFRGRQNRSLAAARAPLLVSNQHRRCYCDRRIGSNQNSNHKCERKTAQHLAAKYKEIKLSELTAVLAERERLGSTAIGDGIAIPHGKLRGVTKIIGAFGRQRRRSHDGGDEKSSPNFPEPPAERSAV